MQHGVQPDLLLSFPYLLEVNSICQLLCVSIADANDSKSFRHLFDLLYKMLLSHINLCYYSEGTRSLRVDITCESQSFAGVKVIRAWHRVEDDCVLV